MTATALTQAGTPREEADGLRPIRVKIRRSGGGTSEFVVETSDPVTVLDLLRQIQTRHDASLAFRYSCRVAMCGTCGVRVDGRSKLACRTVLDRELRVVHINETAARMIHKTPR